MKKFFIQKHKNLVSFSKRAVLDQICFDLFEGLPSHLEFDERISLYCGIHNNLFPLYFFGRGVKIGIQTEQLFDQAGRVFDRALNKRALRNIELALNKCDFILDISKTNQPFYNDHPLKHKVICAPHFFPHVPRQYSPGNKDTLLFIGTMTERRKYILSKVRNYSIEHRSAHKDELRDLMIAYAGIANIHSLDLVYTETPRLVTAALNGKVFVSETLSNEFVKNQHYIDISSNDSVDHQTIYKNFAKYTSENFSFYQYLLDTI